MNIFKDFGLYVFKIYMSRVFFDAMQYCSLNGFTSCQEEGQISLRIIEQTLYTEKNVCRFMKECILITCYFQSLSFYLRCSKP